MAQDFFELSQLGPVVVSTIDTHLGSQDWRTGGSGTATLLGLSDVPDAAAEGEILVYRNGIFAFEAKPAGGSNPALADVSNVTIDAPADNEVLAYDEASSRWINQTPAEAGLAQALHTHDVSDVSGAIGSDPTGITGASAVGGMLAFDTQANLDAWGASADYDPAIYAFTTEVA